MLSCQGMKTRAVEENCSVLPIWFPAKNDPEYTILEFMNYALDCLFYAALLLSVFDCKLFATSKIRELRFLEKFFSTARNIKQDTDSAIYQSDLKIVLMCVIFRSKIFQKEIYIYTHGVFCVNLKTSISPFFTNLYNNNY